MENPLHAFRYTHTMQHNASQQKLRKEADSADQQYNAIVQDHQQFQMTFETQMKEVLAVRTACLCHRGPTCWHARPHHPRHPLPSATCTFQLLF